MRKLRSGRRGLIVLAVGLMSLALGVPALAATPRVHDLATPFLDFWKKERTRPLPEQVSTFKARMVPAFPAFYRYRFDKWIHDGKSIDRELGVELTAFPAMARRFAAINKGLSGEIHKNLGTFERIFPRFNADFDIYVMHSLGELDGGTRVLDGSVRLIFGVDGIAKYHQEKAHTAPFFAHELFHVYHSQQGFHEGVMYTALWAEGLATYVSERLNPGSSMVDIMLDVPPHLISRCRADMPYLWNDLASRLESDDDRDYTTYFLPDSKDPRIPPRTGYYLGYLLAKEMGKRRNLDELVALQGPLLLAELKATITVLRGEARGRK